MTPCLGESHWGEGPKSARAADPRLAASIVGVLGIVNEIAAPGDPRGNGRWARAELQEGELTPGGSIINSIIAVRSTRSSKIQAAFRSV
jgi:hypothetical protein